MGLSLSTSLSAARGAVMADHYQVQNEDFTVPVITNAIHAIVRITSSDLCGLDLHRYHGYVGREPPGL